MSSNLDGPDLCRGVEPVWVGDEPRKKPDPFVVIRWARRQRIANVVAKNVLNAIATFADHHGVCFPSQAELADQTGYSDRAVRMALAILDAEGFLKREERRRSNGSRTSDLIRLNLVPVAYQRQDVPVVETDAEVPATGTSRPTKRNLVPNQPAPDSGLTTFELPGELPKEESSEPIGSGTGEPAPDRKRIFLEGRPSLVALGLHRRTAGAVIETWLRQTDDPSRVLDAIRSAHQHRVTAPIPWINAYLQPRQSHVRTTDKSELQQALDDAAVWLRALEQSHAGDSRHREGQPA